MLACRPFRRYLRGGGHCNAAPARADTSASLLHSAQPLRRAPVWTTYLPHFSYSPPATAEVYGREDTSTAGTSVLGGEFRSTSSSSTSRPPKPLGRQFRRRGWGRRMR